MLTTGLLEKRQEFPLALGASKNFSNKKDNRANVLIDMDKTAILSESLEKALELALYEKGLYQEMFAIMRTMDEFSEDEHRNIGRVVSEEGVDVFVAVGAKMGLAAKESMKGESGRPVQEVYSFTDADSAKKEIMEILKEGDTVLVKGSRAMSMERIVGDIVDAV